MRGNEHTGSGPVRTVPHGQGAWPLCLSTWISHGPPLTLLLVFAKRLSERSPRLQPKDF